MNLSIVLPAVGTLHVLVGAYLLKRVLWPRRVGQTPHCPKCDYILVGTPSRCPECGTPVDAGRIVHGERKRRPILVLLGGWFALFGLAMLILVWTAFARSIDWNRHKPLGWLLHDLRSTNTSRSSSAWDEIQRRGDAHLLSESDQSRVVDTALPLLGTALPPSIADEISKYVAARLLEGRLSAKQANQYFASVIQMALFVRPVVGSTNGLPYTIEGSFRHLVGWCAMTRTVEFQIDAKPFEKFSEASSGGFGGGDWAIISNLPPVATPGLHHLRFKLETTLDPDRNKAMSGDPHTPVARRIRHNLVADFRVVDGPTPIETVTEPDASDLRSRFTVEFHRLPGRPTDVRMYVHAAAPLPVDAAFDAFLRFDGKEYRAGSMLFHAANPIDESLAVHDLPPDRPAQTDVVLRSSEAIARNTIDITRIWKGEIVLPNVPLPHSITTRPATAPAAATAPTRTR